MAWNFYCFQIEMSFEIAVIGRTVKDEWNIPSGMLSENDFYGGPGANVAFHLSLLGIKCTLVTVFGTDDFSRLYRKRLLETGVDLSFSVELNAPLPCCKIWPGKHFEWQHGQFCMDTVGKARIQDAISCSYGVYFADYIATNIDFGHFCRRLYCSPQRSLFNDCYESHHIFNKAWDAVFFNKKESIKFQEDLKIHIDVIAAINNYTNWIVTNEEYPLYIYKGNHKKLFKVPHTAYVQSIGGGDAFAAGYCAADIREKDQGKAVLLGLTLAQKVVSQIGCQLDPSNRDDMNNLWKLIDNFDENIRYSIL